MNISVVRLAGSLVGSCALLALAACGGGGTSPPDGGTPPPPGGGSPPPTYSIGGTVTGLAGTGLKIRNGDTDNLSVAADGAFKFSAALAGGAAYHVTVITQPDTPAQVCTVASGDGTVGTSNVSSVAITCVTTPPPGGGGGGGGGGAPTSYSIGGTVSGLAGTGLTILNNATGEVLSISADGEFTFPTALASGVSYKVIVYSQPTARYCRTPDGSGTVGTSNVTNVAITCVTPLILRSTTPESSATDVSRGVAPMLTFLAPLDPATLTTSAVSLKSSAGNVVAVTLKVSGSDLTVVPTDALLPLTDYTLSVGIDAVRGSGGERLVSPVTTTFTTRDRSWQTARSIVTPAVGDALNPQVAVDAHGNSLVVWEQAPSSSDPHRIQAIGHRTAGDFRSQTTIDSAGGKKAQIAMNAAGNAVAVWLASSSGGTEIWSNRYTPESGWGTPEPVDAGATAVAPEAGFLHIAIDPNGNAIAVWVRGIFSVREVWVNRYVAGIGWGAAAAIPTARAFAGYEPAVAMAGNGNALVTWPQLNASHADVMWAAYTTNGGGWSPAKPIEPGNTNSAYLQQVAFDADGNALAVWIQRENNEIRSSRYSPVSGWDPSQLIQTGALVGTVGHPQIAIDPSGNAIAVWEQRGSGNTGWITIWSNRYRAGSWGAAAEIETDPLNASFPELAMDASGNAIVVWSEQDGALSRLSASRYTSAGGWSPAVRIADDAADVRVAVDANGDAVVVWTRVIRFPAHEVWSTQFE